MANTIDNNAGVFASLSKKMRIIPPTAVFKHVKAKHADQFRSGEEIKIATFEHYRQGEAADDRVDKLEGIASNHVNRRIQDMQPGDPDYMQQQRALRSLGFDYVDGTVIQDSILENFTHRVVLEPQYIFCASIAPDFNHARQENERIFQIADIARFGLLLSSARPDILRRFRHSNVIYEKRERNPFEGGSVATDPFRKSNKFQFENEHRLIWEPGLITTEWVIVKAPAVAQLITEIFVPKL